MHIFKGSNSPAVGRFLLIAATVLFALQTGIALSFADNQVRKAQATMLVLGVNAGPVDGIWGPRTQRGVWAFQEMAGLPVSGKLDAATISHLAARKHAVLTGEEPAESSAVQAGADSSGGAKTEEEPAVEKEAEIPVEKSATPKKAAEPEKAAAPAPVKAAETKPAPAPPAPVKAPASPPSAKQTAESSSATTVSGQLPAGFKITGKYEEGPVSDGGSISGLIKFIGNVPAPIMEDLSKGKNVEFCGGHPDAKDNIRPRVKVAVAGGKLQDAVVFIQNIEKGKAWAGEVINFDFKNCDIFPKVSVVRKTPKGVKTGLLTITNQDPDILHNPHGYSVAGANRKTLFNKPLPSKGSVADVTKNFKRFKPAKDKHFFLQCDQHNYMEADARIIWNPYYAISGADGSFIIDQIPAGKYWVTVWHPYIGQTSSEVVISGGAEKKMNFALALK